jgi:hypothetical protein
MSRPRMTSHLNFLEEKVGAALVQKTGPDANISHSSPRGPLIYGHRDKNDPQSGRSNFLIKGRLSGGIPYRESKGQYNNIARKSDLFLIGSMSTYWSMGWPLCIKWVMNSPYMDMIRYLGVEILDMGVKSESHVVLYCSRCVLYEFDLRCISLMFCFDIVCFDVQLWTKLCIQWNNNIDSTKMSISIVLIVKLYHIQKHFWI